MVEDTATSNTYNQDISRGLNKTRICIKILNRLSNSSQATQNLLELVNPAGLPRTLKVRFVLHTNSLLPLWCSMHLFDYQPS